MSFKYPELNRICDRYSVEDVLTILNLDYNLDYDDVAEMEIEDVVRLYRKKIMDNLELFNTY